ncbi:TPA: hypothetical protein N0F65_001164 [Lagenidium giganteum]|uniref:Uncharacterized protein n=1 Tax=Lagenidium giganteum TaxID=4803 RepID=A0AAV2YXD8_9STRA|nr:TPA: hypothetical protein N0F65_001164 [Lagenidium giganteum]
MPAIHPIVADANEEADRQHHHEVQLWFRRMRSRRTRVFDEAITFSFLRLLGLVTSYLLLCSDVARSGLGIRSLRQHHPLEPDAIQLYGPWAYPVDTIYANDTSGDVADWNYKFDTCSIVWRAFAQFYNATTFPDCLLYRSECPNREFPRTALFAMMDELANRTRDVHPHIPGRPFQPVGQALRTKSVFRDRLHHLLLPWWFMTPLQRFNQAIYYHPVLLPENRFNLCAFIAAQPAFCQDLWPNLHRSCSNCDGLGLIWQDIRDRHSALMHTFPGAHVDLTLLASVEHAQSNSGGLTFESMRILDVSTVLRVLQCPPDRAIPDVAHCSTIAVDNYRYEAGVFMSSATGWYVIIATLRCFAQVYFLRLAVLAGGCYVARAQERPYMSKTWRVILRAAFHTLPKIPCQGIVYGSPLPVMCYVLAHCLDVQTTYRLVSEKFETWSGSDSQFDFFEACVLMAVQMRNVWLLGFAIKAIAELSTRNDGWTPGTGILGFRKYVLSVFATITILAPYRHTSFRDSRILDVFPVPFDTKHIAIHRSATYVAGVGSYVLDGIWIDIKCLSVIIMATATVLVLLWGALWRHPRQQRLTIEWLCTRTPVPYSSRILWPMATFSTYWSVNVFPAGRPGYLMRSSRKGWTSEDEPVCVDWPVDGIERRAFVRSQMENIHKRTADAHALVAFFNLFAMTDPLVWLRLRWFGGVDVCIVRHIHTGNIFCVPQSTLEDPSCFSLPAQDLVVIETVNTQDMTWSDLLHCG